MERTKESLNLTPRLQAIADRVPQGARLADVGTDHGHLPLWLLTQGRLEAAIASDIRQGPLAHAQENAKFHELTDRVRFVLAPGLEGVRADECDVVTVAGMGGETMISILEAAPWTADGAHLLLLQPMTMLPQLRQWLWSRGYGIEEECVCREGRRYYLVWTVYGGGQAVSRPLTDCVVSDALCRAPQAEDYLRRLLERETRALEGMERGTAAQDQLEAQRAVVRRIRAALEGSTCQL